jgi:hypothetical protein
MVMNTLASTFKSTNKSPKVFIEAVSTLASVTVEILARGFFNYEVKK